MRTACRHLPIRVHTHLYCPNAIAHSFWHITSSVVCQCRQWKLLTPRREQRNAIAGHLSCRASKRQSAMSTPMLVFCTNAGGGRCQPQPRAARCDCGAAWRVPAQCCRILTEPPAAAADAPGEVLGNFLHLITAQHGTPAQGSRSSALRLPPLNLAEPQGPYRCMMLSTTTCQSDMFRIGTTGVMLMKPQLRSPA